MASVMGNGPFEFTNANGNQVSIPLSALSFDSANVIQVDPAWQAKAAPGMAFLQYLVQAGTISAAPSPSPFPAMVIQAADPGWGGNNIQVTVKNVKPSVSGDPTQTTFSLVVTEIDVYSGLTAANVQSTLANLRGLVQVQQNSMDPKGGVPIGFSGGLSASPSELLAEVQIPDSESLGSPSVFCTLVAKKSGLDGALTTVTITPGAGGTFSLKATWIKEADSITVLNVAAKVQQCLAYEIAVSPPSSGVYSVPAAGSVTLSGGGAGAASATLFTGL